MMTRPLTLLLWLLAASCTETPEVGLCLRTAPDDPDPLGQARATDLVVRAIPAPGGGQQELRFFAPDAESLRLPALEYGRWQFVVQALAVDDVIATGRTPLVEVRDEHAQIPCIYVATVGTFGRTTNDPPASDPRVAFATSGSTTALVATDDGLVRYDHVTGELSEPTPLPVSPAGAIWATLGGGQAAAILPDGQGVILDSTGAVTSTVSVDPLVGNLDGATAVGVGSTTVLLIGGAPDAATPPVEQGSVREVDLETGAVRAADSATGLAVRDARIEDLGNLTFLVVGDNASSAESPTASDVVAIVDASSTGQSTIAGVVSRASLQTPRLRPIVAVSGSNVLVLGGLVYSDTDLAYLPSTAIEHFRIASRQLVRMPQTDQLGLARAAGLGLVAADEIVLVGGETATEADAVTAEHVSFDSAPVQCSASPEGRACDPPDVPLPSPVAVGLHDGAILVVGRGAAVVYRP